MTNVTEQINPQPDQAMALAFVQAVTGKENPVIRVRVIHDKEKDTAPAEASGTVDELWPDIVAVQEHGLGVFWLPNLCGFQGEGFAHDKDATSFHALFCDFDGELPTQWHRQPDLIVHTSPGHGHAYWLISDGTADEWKHGQRRLIGYYKGADPAIKNPSRLMRLPGTLHQKREPFLVTFTSNVDGDDRAIGLPTIAEVLDDIPDVAAAPTPKQVQTDVPVDDPRNIAEAKRVIARAKPAIEGERGDDKTFALGAILCRDLNLSPDTALELLKPWNDRCSPPWSEDELRAKLENAASYGENERGSGTPKSVAEAFAGVVLPQLDSPDTAPLVPVSSHGPRYVGAVGLIDNPLPFPDVNKNTGALRPTAANARVALINVGLRCQYDSFHDKIIVGGRPLHQWVGQITDEIIARLCYMTSEAFHFEPAPQTMLLAVQQLAYENKFNPVVSYLDGLEWDGVPRLDTWLIEHGGAPDTPYVRAVSRIVLLAAVRRARHPGCKFDEILVLESPEGYRKSGMIALMAGAENFSDQSILAADDRKQQEQMAGVWLYELADLTGASRAEVERVKAFASRQEDRGRPAYGHVVKHQPRQCVLIATTNDTDFLQSQTGNRRWWPVRITKHFDLKALAAVRDQLWAEAAHLEAKGTPIRLPRELWHTAGQEQEQRRAKHPWEDILANVSGEKYPLAGYGDQHEERILSCDVFSRYLRLEPAQQNSSNGKTAKQIMVRLGWTYRDNLRIGARVGGGYVRTVEGPLPEPTPADETLPDDPMAAA